MKSANKYIVQIILVIILAANQLFSQGSSLTYPIVDTGQKDYFNNSSQISEPVQGSSFYGQDANYSGNQPSYADNGDGTITDNITGLMWSKSTDLNGDGIVNVDDKLNYYDALSSAESLTLAGYNDWRIPSIKELYSLINFSGKDVSGYNGSNTEELTPFIDTDYFEFGYGDESAGERIIDAQFATTSIYVGNVMGGQKALFGVNFADGRIKGYPVDPTINEPNGKGFYILYVRGNTSYGINKFNNNNDGTITDNATGLMWSKEDNGEGLDWQGALEWVQQKNNESYLGYNDWRLPNAKELQSILDYSRSPSTTNSAAIDPLFECTVIPDEGGDSDYPFYWSGTTHENMRFGDNAAYVCFGEALGWMQVMNSNYQLLDVHGAGAQRSDPKAGDPNDYPYGHGPQGDVIRIYNYVRIVRDAPEVDNNNAPDVPQINGEQTGSSNTDYDFNIVCSDIDGNDVYYFVDWDDGNNSGWTGPYQSGAEIKFQHSWSADGEYKIKVKSKDIFDSESGWSGDYIILISSQTTNIDGEEGLPSEFVLDQNYPNPFNPSTTISFTVPYTSESSAQFTKLNIYDILGNNVADLLSSELNPGFYKIQFDASHLSSGIYLYKLTSGTVSLTKKMMLIK